jgi:hypothetical protein
LTKFLVAYIFAQSTVAMPQPETNRNKVVARLVRDGWVGRHGGDHDVYSILQSLAASSCRVAVRCRPA